MMAFIFGRKVEEFAIILSLICLIALVFCEETGIASTRDFVYTQTARNTSAFSSQELLQKAYIAYYGRPGDPAGLSYWVARLDAASGDWRVIIDAFGNSAEATTLLSGLSVEQKIDKLYTQMFGRTAEEGGRTFYANGLTNGSFTLASLAVNIINGSQGDDSIVVANKLAAAELFTAALNDTISASYNENSGATVRSFLAGITSTPTTQAAVDAALAAMVAASNGSGAPTEASCRDFLATNPSPSDIPAVTGLGVAQRSAMLAAGGKLIRMGSRYYVITVPAGYYSAAKPTVIFDMHGTGGYPEAEWNDWHEALDARGIAFIGLAWGGGTPTADTDETIYAEWKQIVDDISASCPIGNADKWLLGFSVGSATSFGVMIRDVADGKLFKGQIAVSGAAISPRMSGIAVLHPTVEAARSNATAVQGIKSWMYCGEKDFDHTWSMCDEMPYGLDFVVTHGGTGLLYRDPNGTHSSLPKTSAALEEMFRYLLE